MKLFWQYVREHRVGILRNIILVLIFAVCFRLYHLPMKAIGYPLVLCLAVGILFVGWDFCKVKRKHDTLLKIKTMTDVITEDFPETEGILEEDYRQIITLLLEEYRVSGEKTNRMYEDMMEYYTVWVHQIKTPIASMRLHLQNEDSPFARTLHSDLRRIEQYVEMVLTFLRLNSVTTDYVIKECDLDKIVRQAVKKFSSDFINKKLKLVYEPLQTTVITDEKWLSFVVEQVLSNALKYTASGSITITLEKEKTLCICDTGIGIAPEDLPRIFEKGYTGYNGRLEQKASGIGLYLCRRICSKLGHTIRVSSAVDVGTRIEIDLAQKKLEIE